MNEALERFYREESPHLQLIVRLLEPWSGQVLLQHGLDGGLGPILLELARRWNPDLPPLDDAAQLATRTDPDELRRLLLLAAAYRLFSRSRGTGYEQNQGELRRHALATAIVACQLAPFYPDDPLGLFAASLFHDLGKGALDNPVQPKVIRFHQLMLKKPRSFIEAEDQILGMTHPQAGAWIWRRMGGSETVALAILGHHEPQKNEQPLVHFVFLADTIAMTLGFSTGLDALKYPTHPGLTRRYRIRPRDLDLIAVGAVDRINRVIPYLIQEPGKEPLP